MLHIESAKYVSGYKLWLTFDDGSEGEVDLSHSLKGSIFEPLKDVESFSKVFIDPELETTVWPNGADFAPEYLKRLQLDQLANK